jgi:hypothetical protein
MRCNERKRQHCMPAQHMPSRCTSQHTKFGISFAYLSKRGVQGAPIMHSLPDLLLAGAGGAKDVCCQGASRCICIRRHPQALSQAVRDQLPLPGRSSSSSSSGSQLYSDSCVPPGSEPSRLNQEAPTGTAPSCA